MKSILCLLLLVATTATVRAEPGKPSFIQWKPCDCSSQLILPEQDYGVSQFDKGKYRIDSFPVSKGRFNCIYIIFQAADSLDPASVTGAQKSTFVVKSKKFVWRSCKTEVEGRSVLRKEALIPNILPRQRQDENSDYIRLRIDADSQEILDRLTPVAEAVIRDAA